MKKLIPLTLLLLTTLYLTAQNTHPIISEYIEGWSTNKAIELYNPTDVPIDLAGYRLTRYSNGSVPPTSGPLNTQWYVELSGMLMPYKTKVFVLDKRDPEGSGQEAPVWDELQARADSFVCPIYDDSYALYFNGDDALALEKLDDTFIDIFGKIGQRPESPDGGTGAWTDTDPFNTGVGVPLSRDHTLVRKSSVTEGVSTNVDKFDILATWDSLPANTFTSLGWHDFDGGPASNQKPGFDSESYAFTIDIEDPSGTSVGTVSATDPDGDELAFYISGGNSYDPFSIDRETGEIRVAKTEELYWRDYTLKVDVTDGTAPVSMFVDVTVEGGFTGIGKLESGMEIFPNPVSSGTLSIQSTKDFNLIEVYNLTGAVMFSTNLEVTRSGMDLNLESLNSGMYLLNVRFIDGRSTTRKIIIK